LLQDNPPPGFLRIDFDRGRPETTFNSHVGTLYAKRGETFIENLSVSIIGSIQPEKLGEIHGLTSDGLMQRFLPIT